MVSRVVSGDYLNWVITNSGLRYGKDFISWLQVETYSLVSENGQTSTKSTVGRAVVGGVLFGGVGAVVGGLTGKKKYNHTVFVQWKNGNRSMIEFDDKDFQNFMYKASI